MSFLIGRTSGRGNYGFLDISFLGDKELERKLRRLELAMQKKIVRAALRKAAIPALEAAKQLAPVETGRMRDSLKIRALTGAHRTGGKRGNITGVVIETGKRAELGIAEDDKFFYPAIIEYKHKSFMRAAIDQNEGVIMGTAAREIRAGILREVS